MAPATNPLAPLDTLRRPVRDLRISVTDRCNFRCSYCMPKAAFGHSFRFLPKERLLTFEEIERVAGSFIRLGARKLRLTGGEPLLRAQLPRLVEQLAPLGADIAITTNGSLLAKSVKDLANAGLSRITVSLDALDDVVFRRLNDVDFPVSSVLAGIEAATAVGLPIKVNCVVRRGHNEGQLVELARFFRGSGHIIRFIEFMDVGITNGWRLDQVVSAREIVELIGAAFPLSPTAANYPGEVARRFVYDDGAGEIGVIASVTEPFCGGCTRARLSAEGQLYTCLFAATGVDLRATLRAGAPDEALDAQVGEVWRRREDRYSELRSIRTRSLPKIEMSYIGG